MKLIESINAELKSYVESEIIPRYDSFDTAHQRDHVLTVIEQSLALATHYDVNPDMVYTAAAYHDTGLAKGREMHHSESAAIIRADNHLTQWFTTEQIDTIADAAEDHRASSTHEPRTIYGRIVAEADRVIVPETIIRRTIQYGLSHYAELSREQHYRRTLDHLNEKYAEGGYLKLWIPFSNNARRLKELRLIIKDERKLYELFNEFYDQESQSHIVK